MCVVNLAMRDRLNIPHDKIKFIEEIGSGSFGKVYKGVSRMRIVTYLT
jgi:hypothetical protein